MSQVLPKVSQLQCPLSEFIPKRPTVDLKKAGTSNIQRMSTSPSFARKDH